MDKPGQCTCPSVPERQEDAMPAAGNKIKLTENKTNGSLDYARFSLSYGPSLPPLSKEDPREESYKLLTLLKGDGDVIIEVNSLYLNIPEVKREPIVMEFLDHIKSLGLEYRYRKFTAERNQGLLAKLFGAKKIEAHELFVHVPHETWQKEEFKSILPIHGARYYMAKGSCGPAEALDGMYRMTDEEKLDFYELIVFDIGILGTMGINSGKLELGDLKQILGI